MTEPSHDPVVVVGAGAAGLIAALTAAREGANVILVESTKDGGRKILISGGGRCNILPSVARPERYVTDSSPNTLRKILRSWPLAEQRAFFERELGFELELEVESGKLFPSTHRAKDVRDGLVSRVQEAGAKIWFQARVIGLKQMDAGWSVEIEGAPPIQASAVMLATGGLSVPATGSDGKGLQIAEGTGYILWAVHQLLPTLAAACLWAGHIDRAEQVGSRLRRHAERIDHRLGRAWADACDSLVCWKRGDSEGSVDLMRKAAEDLEAVPYIWTATRLRRQLAGRLLELGRRDEALQELATVHAVCARVRAGLELEKTRAMYRDIGARPPPIAVEGGPLGLTPSEVAVAIRVAQGMSNRQIATELKCATRTASTHLSNIYSKLDIGGPGARVRLGNRVREAGLID